GCTSLSSVSMPSAVTINPYAFEGCTSLASVSMPSAVTVGSSAFKGCTSLASVSMPFAEIIDGGAFWNCTSLASVSMPSAVTVGSRAFENCTSLASVSMPSVSSISSYSYYPSFSGCTSISRLVIPCNWVNFFSNRPIEELTMTEGNGIGFSGPLGKADQLVSLTVEDGVRSIGSGAFNGCTSLEYVYLADSVEEIKNMAFCGCTSLATFHAPESLSSVGEMAFHKVSFLDVDGTPVEPGSRSFNGQWFVGEGGTLYREVPVEDGMEFSSDDLVYAVISSEDMEAAVIGCADGVSKVVVPAVVSIGRNVLDVTEISEKAFYSCTALTSVDLGSVSKVGVKAFAQCTRLKTVCAGDSLSTISAYAFAKCTRLVDFDLSGSLKTMKVIGSYAFLKDAKLSGIAIPSFVATVGGSAFDMPFSDENGTVLAADAASLAGYEYANVGGILVRQPGVEVGKEFSWNGLTLVVTASLPAEVGISGYSGKPAALVLSGPVELEGIVYNITSVMKDAFKGCRTILSAELPGIERLDAQAFYGCSNLASFSAPDLLSVGTKALARCTSLTDLELGEGLTTISAYGFWGCSSLVSVTLPDTVRSIGTYAFQRCSSMSSIDLGESLRLIGSKAFDGTAVVTMEIPDTIVRLKEGAISGCSELREVSFEGGTKVILHAGILEGDTNIERISMPDGFKRIYSGAFDGITFLDGDGNTIVANAKNLAGHVFAGSRCVLAIAG
ncbi:MAG: leucine-rich repeat domain-containing protein, partial [Candidatus Methanomethylophilaceae archaeon]|nr:leucine-rich repeat domain-containing protein [Candidatus Methanomethylophilaceae archaeon]